MNPSVSRLIELKSNDWQLKTVGEIRDCILRFLPQVQESIKWKIPFYHIDTGNICFINIRKKEVVIGFYWGAKYNVGRELLSGDGVQVRHLVFQEKDNVDMAILKVLLEESLNWLDHKPGFKRKTKK